MTAPNLQSGLYIQLLGTFALRRDSQALSSLRTRKEAWLLALLVLRHPYPVERGWLAGALWPDSDDAQARYNLRRALSSLRDVLGPDASRLTAPTPRSLALDLAGAQADVLVFDEAVKRGDTISLAQAIAAYHGPLLEDCGAAWAAAERRQREEAFLNALERLGEEALRRQQWTEASRLLRRALDADPLREEAVQHLMHALANGGDATGALTVYREFRLLLSRELRAEPSRRTQQLYNQIKAPAPGARSGMEPQAAMDIPAPAPSFSARRLPCALTPLIGRERERETVQERLRTARIVTLTGAGGVGKTRLAIATGEAMECDFTEGVWFVDFAPLTTPLRAAQTVAAALRVSEDAQRGAEERLRQHLERKSLLLIWDNCEHVASECARLAHTLLSCCPGLRLLATSRQALGVVGETVWRVPSLSLLARILPEEAGAAGLPFQSGTMDTDAAMTDAQIVHACRQSEAARLFVARASALAPALNVTPAVLRDIARICRLLDGIPLAIELAAAWCAILTPAQIVCRLEDPLQNNLQDHSHNHLLLLGQPGGEKPQRHETLRAVLEASCALLTRGERELLARLSVFAGGWTLEAAEVVCADEETEETENREPGTEGQAKGEGRKENGDAEGKAAVRIVRQDVLPLLAGLVNMSLVAADEQQGAARYRLLETTRVFARGRPGEQRGATVMRHADYFERQTYAGWSDLRERRNVRRWHVWAGVERPNCLAALAWRQAEDGGSATEFRLALYQSKVLSYHAPEMRQWIARLQSQPLPPASALQSAIYGYVGQCAEWIGDNAAGCRLMEQSLDLARACSSAHAIAEAEQRLALVAFQEGDHVVAQARFERALALYEQAQDCLQAAVCRDNLASLACHGGRIDEAREWIACNRRIGQAERDERLLIDVEWRLARMARDQGYRIRCARHLHAFVTLARQTEVYTLDTALMRAGRQAGAIAEYEMSLEWLREAITASRESGVYTNEAWSWHYMAETALAQTEEAEALDYARHSLRIFHELGERGSASSCLALLERVCAAQSRAVEGVTLLAHILASVRQTPLLHTPDHVAGLHTRAAAWKEQMPAAAFHAAWRGGEDMTPDQAVAVALQF